MEDTSVRRISILKFKKFIEKEELLKEELIDDLLSYSNKRDGEYIYYGIFINKDIVGYASVYKKEYSHLDRLYINPLHRRKGLAKQLIDELKIQTVFVQENNKNAIKFYNSLGFKRLYKVYDVFAYFRKII